MAAARKLARKRATQVSSAHQSPGIETFVPEIRSDVKWRPTPGAVPPFAVPSSAVPVIAVWNYGVAFKEMDKFHQWLRASETQIAGMLKTAVAKKGGANKVFYLGTYLNIDSGTPMYQTYWGYTSEEALDKETAWPPLPQGLRKLIKELRGYWVRDPGRSESRFGLASNYSDVSKMPNNGLMLQITIEAAK